MAYKKPDRVWTLDTGMVHLFVDHGSWFDKGDNGYWPFYGGCGIHQPFKTLEEAKDFAIDYAIRSMEFKQDELVDTIVQAQLTIKDLKKLKFGAAVEPGKLRRPRTS